MSIYYVDFDLTTGDGTGGSWANAIKTAAAMDTLLDTTVAAGDVVYVKQSTWTLTEALGATARDGTALDPICIVGVKDGTTDEPPPLSAWSDTNLTSSSGEDRPIFSAGAYTISLGDYWKVFNIKITGSASTVITGGNTNVFYNCYVENSSGTANRTALAAGTQSSCILTECKSTNGYSLSFGSGGKMVFCYVHDSVRGVSQNSYFVCLFNIFDTCSSTGIEVASYDSSIYFGNSFYNCPTAFNATDSYGNVSINNIIDTATDGFLWTSQVDINFYSYNHVGNSVTDMWDTIDETNPENKDNWVTSGDPDFTNEAGGNFSLESTSPCINAGMAMALGVGL